MKWPAHLPDLKPTKLPWKELDCEAKKHYLTLQKHPWETLRNIWEAIKKLICLNWQKKLQK